MPIYLFGVTDDTSPVEYGAIGFADPYGERADVKAIHYGGISMITCGLDEWRLNEADKPDLLNKLLEHQKIMEGIMKKRFILPIKFGTTVDSEHDVIKILSDYRDQLKRGIEEVRNLIEADIVVTWDPIGEVKKIATSDSEIKKIKGEVEKLPEGKRAQAVMEVGMLLQNKLEEKRKEIEKTIITSLSPHCLAHANHERLEDKMVVNSSFLVKEGQEKKLFSAVDELDKKFDNAFKFKCLYPLPPHSFKTVVITKVNQQELKEAIEMLELGPHATLDELKENNRRLTKKLHPDKAGKESAEKFDKLKKSYNLLAALLKGRKNLSDIDVKRCYVVEMVGEVA